LRILKHGTNIIFFTLFDTSKYCIFYKVQTETSVILSSFRNKFL